MLTTNPTDVSITYGANASFTAAASGSPAPTVKWQVDAGSGFADMSPAQTSTTLNLTKPTVAISGNKYRAVFTNACSSATSTAATLTVNKKALTVTGITASNKVYDGTTSATINTASAALVGVVSGDTVNLNTASATGAFLTKTVGSGKNVPIAGLTISGVDSGNYSLTQPNTTADITAKSLSVSFQADNKVYDGTTDATIKSSPAPALVGVVSGDTVTLGTGSATASFADKNVGTGKTVTGSGFTKSGADAGNYVFASPQGSTTATISKRSVTASITAADKTYDGTDDAQVTSCSLEAELADHGVVSPDDVDCSASNGHFADADAGVGKNVTADVELTGTDKTNYELTSASASTTATISKRSVTASITAADKTYDGTDDAQVTSCSLEAELADHGVVSPDDVDCSASNGHFADADAGVGKNVTADVELTGTDKTNYELTSASASTTATISKRSVTASITAADKTYDGTDDAQVTSCSLEAELADHGVVSPDDVDCSASNGHFADADAGVGKNVTADVELTGTDKTNYELTSASASTTATISKRSVTASITAADKTYDGTDDAQVTSCSLEAELADHGVVSPDDVDCSASNGHFADADAGVGKNVTADVELTGTDKANYELTSASASTTATISKRSVTASITAADKTYDGTDDAQVTSCSLEAELADHGVVSPDDVDCSASNGHFADADAGVGKNVTADVELTGTDKTNYELTSASASTTATISKRSVTASITAADKTYDGTDDAQVTSCSLEAELADHGVVSPDDGRLLAASNGHFGNKNVGDGKTVTADVELIGGDKANYQLTSPSAATTANISERDLTVTATGVNKVYDGNANATVNLSTDKVSGDSVSAAYTAASFNNKNVGNAKPVSVTGISISGTDASNYNLTNTTAATTANITPKTVTGTFTAANKVFDTTTAATITGRSLSGVVSGDDVSLTGGTATFNSPAVGNGKTVTGVGFTLSGADTPNYSLASSTLTTTANITAWNALGYGFYQPVGVANSTFTPSGQTTPTTNPGDYWNTVKGGSTVPLKFNVFAGAVEKTSLADIASFQQGKLSNCSGGVGEDPIDITSTGNTSLRYDGTGGQWIQNWATPKVNGDTCYRAWVTFADGSTLEAFFKLKK